MRKISTEAERLTKDVLKVREARRAHDRRGHAGLRHDPRERDLRHAYALALCELFNAGGTVYGR